MSRARSYVVTTDANGKKHEANAYTCGHCNRIVVTDRTSPMSGCRMCTKLICPSCDQRGSCTPFERRMEIAEARARSRRSMGV